MLEVSGLGRVSEEVESPDEEHSSGQRMKWAVDGDGLREGWSTAGGPRRSEGFIESRHTTRSSSSGRIFVTLAAGY